MKNKITNAVLAIMFILFAALQANDPDPWWWVLLYLVTGVVCMIAAYNTYIKPLIALAILACLATFLYYVPGLYEWATEHQLGDIVESMKAEKGYIEESRESLGALLALAVLAYQYVRAGKGKND